MYLAEALPYLLDIFTWYNFLAIFVGVVVGIVIGAIPGLSPPMAIALMIPISFNFPPITALLLMVSTYAAGIFGGSFSAILLRTPGTSASAASTIEGFELTKRGKAIEAIRISTFASVLGGIISGVVLLLLAPPLAKVSLWFGPADYFLVAILGLTAIASVTFGHVAKGLIAGFFGLILSVVGTDSYSGFSRFTFGFTPLEGGFDIMPVIIGLFAFAQGMELCQGNPRSNISGVKKLSWNIWPKYSEIYRCRWALVRGWVCGLGIGIIPAAGGSVAQWIAYAWEIRNAKPGDEFGKGEMKGLAATEASNNGVTGTSLIPMFVLGIPGGIAAAVILGALIIHGLQPGMRLFEEKPEVVYTIMWGFIFANILMGFVAIFLARTMAYLTLFPRGVIGPMILVFSVIGTYTATSNIYDVWAMIGFGVMGYFMYKYNYSAAAVLLGIILGPIAEGGFRDLNVVSHGNPIGFMLTRPLSLAFIACIILALYFSMKGKKETEEHDIPPSESA